MQSTLTTKGQTTVPKEIRDALKLQSGSTMKWFMRHDGSIEVRPMVPATSLYGILKYDGPPVSIEDMRLENIPYPGKTKAAKVAKRK